VENDFHPHRFQAVCSELGIAPSLAESGGRSAATGYPLNLGLPASGGLAGIAGLP
jgi:hypothetical protein